MSCCKHTAPYTRSPCTLRAFHVGPHSFENEGVQGDVKAWFADKPTRISLEAQGALPGQFDGGLLGDYALVKGAPVNRRPSYKCHDYILFFSTDLTWVVASSMHRAQWRLQLMDKSAAPKGDTSTWLWRESRDMPWQPVPELRCIVHENTQQVTGSIGVSHIVWGKVSGFPWWPGRVDSEGSKSGTWKVCFFATKDHAEVPEKSILPFTATPPSCGKRFEKRPRQAVSYQLQNAISKAQKVLDLADPRTPVSDRRQARILEADNEDSGLDDDVAEDQTWQERAAAGAEAEPEAQKEEDNDEWEVSAQEEEEEEKEEEEEEEEEEAEQDKQDACGRNGRPTAAAAATASTAAASRDMPAAARELAAASTAAGAAQSGAAAASTASPSTAANDREPVIEEFGGYKLHLSSENCTGYMGVQLKPTSWRNPDVTSIGGFRSYISLNGRTKHLGTFRTSREAAVAYAKAFAAKQAADEEDVDDDEEEVQVIDEDSVTEQVIEEQNGRKEQAEKNLEANLRALKRVPPAFKPPERVNDEYEYSALMHQAVKEHIAELGAFNVRLQAARDVVAKSQEAVVAEVARLDNLRELFDCQEQRRAAQAKADEASQKAQAAAQRAAEAPDDLFAAAKENQRAQAELKRLQEKEAAVKGSLISNAALAPMNDD